MPTIKDVAKYSGVSVATVSRAINSSGYVHEDTLKKINAAISALNYKPNETARALYNRQSKILGLLLPDISNPFFTLVARGVEDTALENGFHIIIGNSDQRKDKELKYIDTFKVNNCVGFISSILLMDDFPDYVKQSGMIHVTLDRTDETSYSIEAAHTEGGIAQAKCLIDGGCRHILIISGNPVYNSFSKRLNGAIEVLKASNIDYQSIEVQPEEINDELLYKIQNERFDGIICYNDLMAIQVMGLLQNNGIRIPDTVQVVGYDDIQMSRHYYPSLTTIRQPAYLLGKIACEQLIQLIKGEPIQQHIEIPVELIKRNSTRSVNT